MRWVVPTLLLAAAFGLVGAGVNGLQDVDGRLAEAVKPPAQRVAETPATPPRT